MTPRTLVMVTSHRPSSKYRQSITREEADAFWNGYFTLWLPETIANSSGPPLLGSQDEYDTPVADHLFVLPESPYRYHSSDWADRMNGAGSPQFTSTPSWDETLKNLADATGVRPASDDWHAFVGLGMGCLILEAYCEAQDHDKTLDAGSFYEKVQQAARATNAADRQHYLEQAAHQLQEARETVNPAQLYQALTLYPSEMSLTTWHQWLESGQAFTMLSSAKWIQEWAKDHPEQNERLKAAITTGAIDWWGGHYTEAENDLLPLSAELMNLSQGVNLVRKVYGKHIESHGRLRFAAHVTMPGVLQSFGIKRALHFSNDAGAWPLFSNSLAGWRGPDSQLLESCTRKPESIDSGETAFHLGQIAYESTASEHVGWMHFGVTQSTEGIPLWYQCWSALHKLAPVFGHLGNLEQTIRDIPATEQFNPIGADDFQSDHLLDSTNHGSMPQVLPHPVHHFVQATGGWRALECAKTIAAMHGAIDKVRERGEETDIVGRRLLDTQDLQAASAAGTLLKNNAKALAQRLTAGAKTGQPGYLIFNPCAVSRRIAVHLPKASTLMPAPAWASQPAGQGIDAVVEVPPLGYAWLPDAVEKGAKVRVPRQTIAEGNTLRNDYIVVEIDPQTGGIRAIKDAVKEIPRIGQQLVFAPGSTMQCDEVSITRNGHAVGEIQSKGKLVDAHNQVLANYRQTVRLWAGRSLAEIDIHLEPCQLPAGYPWHAYYAARWAWRDQHARLSKSIQWTKSPTSQNRPETPGFIEIESPAGRTTLLSSGMPYWQRPSARMLDTLLIVDGESCQDYLMAVALDEELPHITRQNWLTPSIIERVEKGPPPAGNSTWLFHLDAPSVMIMDMQSIPGSDAILVRLLETFGYATEALLQCPRNPTSASVVNSLGEVQQTLTIGDDGVQLRLGCYEFQQVRLEFGHSVAS